MLLNKDALKRPSAKECIDISLKKIEELKAIKEES